MSQRHYTEDQLEALAREGGGSSLDDHLANCARCRVQWEFFRRYQAEFERQQTTAPDSRVAALARDSDSRYHITLRPFAPAAEMNLMDAQDHLVLLAAQDMEAEARKELEVVTFASRPHKVVLRILRTPPSEEYRIHVLSAQRDVSEYVGIGIRDAEGRTHLAFTDAQGVAVFHPSEPVDWDDAVVVIMIPLLTIVLEDLQKEGHSGSHPQVHVRESGDGLRVHVELEGTLREEAAHALAIRTNGAMSFKDLEGGRTSFDVADSPFRMIKLFS